MSSGERRRERLRRAHLYLVIEAEIRGEPTDPVVAAALAGGVDLVQLRDKDRSDEELVEAALRLRALCDEHDALLGGERPARPRAGLRRRRGARGPGRRAAGECAGDGGRDVLIGVSTHSPAQVEAALGRGRGLLRRGPGARDADEAGQGAGGARAGALRGGHARGAPVLRDRRDRRRRTPRRWRPAGRRAHRGGARDPRCRRSARHGRQSCAQ